MTTKVSSGSAASGTSARVHRGRSCTNVRRRRHDAHAVLYVREKRAQHHVWMSGRHGDGWHGNSLEAQGQAPEEASWRLRWGLGGGFCGGLRGGLRGVSGGLRGVSVPVFVGSPRGLRGSPGVSAPRWHTKHYRAQLRARDTTCTETLCFFIQNVLVRFVRVTAEPPEMYVVASLKSVCAASL